MGKMKSKGRGGGGGGGGKTKKNKNYRAPGGAGKGRGRGRGGGAEGFGNNNAKKPDLPQNPFEIQMNKRKHVTLGRVAKHETGVPGVSRSRAIQKRKSTLLQEYKVRGKSNVLVDKRLGAKSKAMEEEDKIVRRSALEKSRMFKKKSIFNLQDDDEMLTHKGEALNEVDRYDDPRDISDSEEERLDEEFVSEANFGGFLKMKKRDPAGDEEIDEGTGAPKTRDQIIAEMILDSKKRKAEKAKELDENYEKVQELDEEFKSQEFRNLLHSLSVPSKKEQVESLLKKTESKKVIAKDSEPAPLDTKIVTTTVAKKLQVAPAPAPLKQDDYDRLIRELQFERKTGSASNRKKTEEETNAEQAEAQVEKTENRRKQLHDKMVLIMRAFNDIVISDSNSIQKGFDLCDITYQILRQWRKYCPEVIIFLTTLLKSFDGSGADVSQFKVTAHQGFRTANTAFRSHPCWIFQTLEQITKFVLLYKYLPSSYELFKPILQVVTKWNIKAEQLPLPHAHSDQVVKFLAALSRVIDSITSAKEETPKVPVQMEKQKPVPLKLYEPAIDETFDGVRKRKTNTNKVKQTQERLQHKVKRELKSAIREIKKDNAFITRVVRKEEHAKDEERKRKVKELLGDLANQEGDYKKSKRGK